MPAADPAILYCAESDLADILSVAAVTATVDDDQTGQETVKGAGYVQRAIVWATTQVNRYLLTQYDATDLGNSNIVKQWAVVLACKWLSGRRGNPPPEVIDEYYKDAIEGLKEARSGTFPLGDAGLRDAAWPAWSNVSVNILYSLRKIRVERPISERSKPLFGAPSIPRTPDFIADVIGAAEIGPGL